MAILKLDWFSEHLWSVGRSGGRPRLLDQDIPLGVYFIVLGSPFFNFSRASECLLSSATDFAQPRILFLEPRSFFTSDASKPPLLQR